MDRSEVIQTVYRSIRDSLTGHVKHAQRKNNIVIYYTDRHKVTLSFRVKIEKAPAIEPFWAKKKEKI
jgi:hypothetical protein